MTERRSEPRLLCSELIMIRFDGAELTVNLEDISSSGACVQLEEPLEVGTRIRLKGFGGVVKYCLRNEIGYFAGIQFDAGERWSQETWQPQHLLDPSQVKTLASRSRQCPTPHLPSESSVSSYRRKRSR